MIRIIAEIAGDSSEFLDVARIFEDFIKDGNRQCITPWKYRFKAELVEDNYQVGGVHD